MNQTPYFCRDVKESYFGYTYGIQPGLTPGPSGGLATLGIPRGAGCIAEGCHTIAAYHDLQPEGFDDPTEYSGGAGSAIPTNHKG